MPPRLQWPHAFCPFERYLWSFGLARWKEKGACIVRGDLWRWVNGRNGKRKLGSTDLHRFLCMPPTLQYNKHNLLALFVSILSKESWENLYTFICLICIYVRAQKFWNIYVNKHQHQFWIIDFKLPVVSNSINYSWNQTYCSAILDRPFLFFVTALFSYYGITLRPEMGACMKHTLFSWWLIMNTHTTLHMYCIRISAPVRSHSRFFNTQVATRERERATD